jgi:hypothetical protein
MCCEYEPCQLNDSSSVQVGVKPIKSYIMDKLQLSGQNLGRIINSRCECCYVHA